MFPSGDGVGEVDWGDEEPLVSLGGGESNTDGESEEKSKCWRSSEGSYDLRRWALVALIFELDVHISSSAPNFDCTLFDSSFCAGGARRGDREINCEFEC